MRCLFCIKVKVLKCQIWRQLWIGRRDHCWSSKMLLKTFYCHKSFNCIPRCTSWFSCRIICQLQRPLHYIAFRAISHYTRSFLVSCFLIFFSILVTWKKFNFLCVRVFTFWYLKKKHENTKKFEQTPQCLIAFNRNIFLIVSKASNFSLRYYFSAFLNN